MHVLYLTCPALSVVSEGEVTITTTDRGMHENSHEAMHVLYPTCPALSVLGEGGVRASPKGEKENHHHRARAPPVLSIF